MAERESIVLTRDVNIVTIPDGAIGMLRQGEWVTVHQALGDNYTVITSYGHMVRIAGIDADALGKEAQPLNTLAMESNAEAVEKNCWEVMKTVYDPEIPVNIVDLGLVYQCQVKPVEQDQHEVHVMMTLTAPGCGMGPVIQSDVERGIEYHLNIDRTYARQCSNTPWSREMMSEVAKLQLGLF